MSRIDDEARDAMRAAIARDVLTYPQWLARKQRRERIRERLEWALVIIGCIGVAMLWLMGVGQ